MRPPWTMAALVSSQEVSNARSIDKDFDDESKLRRVEIQSSELECRSGNRRRLFGVLDRDSLFAFRCALGKEHDAPEKIHGAVELGIMGMNNALALFIVEALKSARSVFYQDILLFFRGCRNWNIRCDAFLVDN